MTKFVATLATHLAVKDLQVFLKTLARFNSDLPTVYLYADEALPAMEYPGRLIRLNTLTKYSTYNRKMMEQMPSRLYSSLWLEFQAEKMNLMDWVFEAEPNAVREGVFYFDADICFLGPLPHVPEDVDVALSPHNIKDSDEAKFGKYNGGFLWFKTQKAVSAWRAACPTSRFFEQAALETFDSGWSIYKFPNEHNFGWWRLWQGKRKYQEIIKEWSIFGKGNNSGITIGGVPLCSIHTHWAEKSDIATREFNKIVLSFLKGAIQTPEDAALFVFLSDIA